MSIDKRLFCSKFDFTTNYFAPKTKRNHSPFPNHTITLRLRIRTKTNISLCPRKYLFCILDFEITLYNSLTPKHVRVSETEIDCSLIWCEISDPKWKGRVNCQLPQSSYDHPYVQYLKSLYSRDFSSYYSNKVV